MTPLDGVAIVWCDGAFDQPTGKTAHGLVRRTRRYRVAAVIDAHLAGRDAGEVLDGSPCGIPLCADLAEARSVAPDATHFVIGLAPDGGRLPPDGLAAVRAALRAGLHVDAGLHDFLSDDPEIAAEAASGGLSIRDVRKTPPRPDLHGFTGRIEQVGAPRIAVLGTDSAVGKRTTAWLLVDALAGAGYPAELIGTGQTAWMQGAAFGIVLDSLINDFVAGELEHATVSAWEARHPAAIVIEGQGSLMNPAYPGGYEILAATRPAAVVVQHAPARREYDGFPGYPIHPIETQIQAIELISGRPVVAITVNHEGLDAAGIEAACEDLRHRTGLAVCDPLVHGMSPVVEALRPVLR